MGSGVKEQAQGDGQLGGCRRQQAARPDGGSEGVGGLGGEKKRGEGAKKSGSLSIYATLVGAGARPQALCVGGPSLWCRETRRLRAMYR